MNDHLLLEVAQSQPYWQPWYGRQYHPICQYQLNQGCGLGAMVGKLTYGKKQWESLDTRMRSIIPPLHAAMLDILPMVDADTEAFNDYMVDIINLVIPPFISPASRQL